MTIENNEPWYKDFPETLSPNSRPWRSAFNDLDSIAILEQNRDRLYAKLEAGYERIEAEIRNPTVPESEIQSWERFWKQLLREYENICGELQRTV